MDFHLLSSLMKTNQMTLKELKKVLKGGKITVLTGENLQLPSESNTNTASLNFLGTRKDGESVYVSCQYYDEYEPITRIVEATPELDLLKVWPNSIAGYIVGFNGEVMHGYRYSEGTTTHVISTPTITKTFELPPGYIFNTKTENCLIYQLETLDKYLVVQFNKTNAQNDIQDLVQTIFDVNADNACLTRFCDQKFIPIERRGKIIDYIYVIADLIVKDNGCHGYPIQITNLKAKKYCHPNSHKSYHNHSVFKFQRHLLLALNITSNDISGNNEACIYILNNDLDVIKCHTEYLNSDIKSMHKLDINRRGGIVIECVNQLRFVAYRRRRIIKYAISIPHIFLSIPTLKS